MTKFATLTRNNNYSENLLWNIIYYGGDKALKPQQDNDGHILCEYESINSYSGSLDELAKKGYLPQCQVTGNGFSLPKDDIIRNNEDIFFIKQGFFRRYF